MKLIWAGKIFVLIIVNLIIVVGRNYHLPEYAENRQRRSEDEATLRLAQVLFRHGDRSPTHSYPGDMYNETDWPQGYGQLSTSGMQQAFELGEFLQQRYVDTGFLDAEYNRYQLHVRSTNYDRTLMTAYSVLAGLFPPSDDQMWKEELPWQPIPVHTVPLEEDRLLLWEVPCPAFTEFFSKYKSSAPIFTDTVEQNKDLFEYISRNTGTPATWEGISEVLDPIFCQYVSNYTLPDWVTEDVLERLLKLRDVQAGSFIPPKYAYLKGGLLLGEMLGRMKSIETGESTFTEKLFMYSAHDSSIVGFLLTLGIFNNLQPPYTACVIVELFDWASGKHTVSISYKNDSDSEPYPLILDGCEWQCPLDKFAQLVQASIPTDIERECGLTVENAVYPHPPSGASIAVAILTGALLLVILIGGILCCVKRNKLQDNHDYKLVPMEMD